MAAMSSEQIGLLLEQRPLWHIDGPRLVRDWKFSSFGEAMRFVSEVAALAERMDHHPDIDIRYTEVRLGLISHDAKGLTVRDQRMAEVLDGEFPSPHVPGSEPRLP